MYIYIYICIYRCVCVCEISRYKIHHFWPFPVTCCFPLRNRSPKPPGGLLQDALDEAVGLDQARRQPIHHLSADLFCQSHDTLES